MTGLQERLHERLQAGLGDRYTVEEEIGQGGMALVFRARDRKHNRTVAVKVLRPELASSLGPERFLREIEIAAQLQHPHILPVYDSGQAEGLLYYVMPFVSGESLRERLQRGERLPTDEALRIAREVANALDYAHRQGIVHRDIKPANVLLSDGHAVVADFGIARALSASAQGGLTQAGMAVGTPTYMSPEQALGEQNLDGRTDIYALGCVLYEMLVGSPPFDGPTPQAVVAKTLQGGRPRLASDPNGVQPILERALAREPADRFATAAELTQALDAVTSGVGYRFRVSRRRRSLLLAGGAAVATVLAVLLWPRGFRVDGDPRQSLIIYPFENQTGDASLGYLEEGAMNLLGLAVAQWHDLRVFDDERTASLLRRKQVNDAAALDFDQAQALAREAKVGTLVLGDIRREGDSLTVEAKIHDVRSGERLATEIVRAGWGADPRPIFDQLAARILRISGAPPGERPDLVAQTTRSLEAYQAYISGVGHLQHFQIDSAKADFERAIQLDSTFALAYVRLRDAVGWEDATAAAERRALITKAQRHSGSLPPRLRNLVQYYAAYESGQLQRAREIAMGMIERDSTDVEAWYQLGEAHFHDQAQQFPHGSDRGNVGRALRAFQRALKLDSSYVLAYRHILNALNFCAAPNNFVLCLADSAAYGYPSALAAQFGEAETDRLRQEARDAQLATARGWVSVEPTLPLARQELALALINEERWDEAKRETDELRNQGAIAAAAGLEALLAAGQGAYGDAGWWLSRGLAAGDTMAVIGLAPIQQIGLQAFAGAGRVTEAVEFARSLLGMMTIDSLPAHGGVQIAKQDLLTWLEAVAWSQTRYPVDSATAAMHRWLDLMERRTANDTALRRAAIGQSAQAAVLAYLAEHDTTLLVRVRPYVSGEGVVSAQLALARGDTVTARRAAVAATGVDLASGTVDSSKVPDGAVRLLWAVAWGDVLGQLGHAEAAAAVYAYADSAPHPVDAPGLLVQSWVERAGLLQRLGRTQEAIALYQRYIEAWDRADPGLQPLVERARQAVAALRGEVQERRS